MAAIAPSKPTYLNRMAEDFRHYEGLQVCFTDLTQRINVSLETLGTLSTALSATELPQFLEKQYENYDTMVKGHKVGAEALKQYKETLARCTPAQVALNPDRIAHLEGLGYNMGDYPEKEVALAQSSVKLATIVTHLQQLVEKTATYIEEFPCALDIPARHQRQQLRKERTYGDKLPDNLGGAKGYFLKGLKQYHEKSSTASSTTAATDNTAILNSLTDLISAKN